MNGIGISLSPKFVYIAFGQKQKSNTELIDIEQIRIPLILPTPNKLHYIRTFVFDYISFHKIEAVGIRIADRQAPNTSLDRVEIEGILQELITKAHLKIVHISTLRVFAEELGITKNYNDLLSGKIDFSNVKHWYINSNTESREASIACVAALNKYKE